MSHKHWVRELNTLPQETNLSHYVGSVENARTPYGLHRADQVFSSPAIVEKRFEVNYSLCQCHPVQPWNGKKTDEFVRYEPSYNCSPQAKHKT